jgi:probable phosphoglycerate mutase
MTDVVEIILVRHASTAWSGRRYCGRSDPPLSASGRAEAVALADRLAPSLAPSARLIASPSRRTVATTEAIAAAAGGQPFELDDRWREIDFGLAEGRTFDELRVIAPATATAILAGATEFDWPGGETSRSLAARVAAAWLELAGAGVPAVVVTHAGPILHALALANGRPIRASDLLGPATAARVAMAVGKAAGPPVLLSRS